MTIDLSKLDSFGEVAAEDDAVLLDYFLSTPTHKAVSQGTRTLVLGRKGAGKTALVRAFTERASVSIHSKALRFRDYPWSIHADRVDLGASEIEAYTASWEYLIAIHLALLAREAIGDVPDDTLRRLDRFLKRNYGAVSTSVQDTLRPDSLFIDGSLEPMVFGNKLGRLDFKRTDGGKQLGKELTALSVTLLTAVGELAARHLRNSYLLLHLDELDLGMSSLDPQRARMLTGLVLAARSVRRRFEVIGTRACPVVYLRTDIWDALSFSDKNKITETHTLTIEWTPDELRRIVEARASKKLGADAHWDDLADPDLVRGSQLKWNHIVQRTYLRPRDVIKFCNVAFNLRHDRAAKLSNEDVTAARTNYSTYLKRELDDEIKPHWDEWDKTLDVLSSLQHVTFAPTNFMEEMGVRGLAVKQPEALERLYDFSVIGYQTRSGYGGSGWVFRYETPSARWDPGTARCKVHLGLKEYCRLKEERSV